MRFGCEGMERKIIKSEGLAPKLAQYYRIARYVPASRIPKE